MHQAHVTPEDVALHSKQLHIKHLQPLLLLAQQCPNKHTCSEKAKRITGYTCLVLTEFLILIFNAKDFLVLKQE